MFPRTLSKPIQADLRKYRAVGLVGPRQSGKTTLAKVCAPDFQYVSLENPDSRARAIEDPRLFLKSLNKSAILDEIQYAPELFSYLQEILDNKSDARKFVLTGSNSFQLNEKISQSLAGRIRIHHVLPLTLEELPPKDRPKDIDSLLVKGLYPRIYDKNLEPSKWFSDYYQTYIQKDIKTIINVADNNQFDRFVRLCAGRISHLSEYASIASEIGVSQPTAVRWASVLESSFITFRLAPHFKNFNKRIVKTSKLYFYDTGLLCQLLRIRSAEMLLNHPLRGPVFENFIVAEFFKTYVSHAHDPPLYFWRDQHGHEVDLIADLSDHFVCIEIKSGATFRKEWLKNLEWFSGISKKSKLALLFGGDDSFQTDNCHVYGWRSVNEVAKSLFL